MSIIDRTVPGGENQFVSLRMQQFVIGALAVALSAISITLVAVSAPWEIRFPAVAAAAVFGPAIPILRIRADLSLEQCLVYGIGVDVALLMLVSLALVMVHAWVPVAACMALFALSAAAGLKLLSDTRKG
jgi:hypothetical protein